MAGRVLQGMESPTEKQNAAVKLRRPAYGFAWLALLSFMVAVVNSAIPLYLQGRF